MPTFHKSVIASALVFTVGGISLSASSQAVAQVAPPPAAATALPDVFVPGAHGYGGYTTRAAPGRSAPHYRVPAGYDADVALHPYTSGLGPCPQGATPSQGCHHPTGHPIPPSHYDRPPFDQ